MDDVTDGSFWRAHALEDLMPLWAEHAPDDEYGAFHLTLSRQWEPTEPRDKVPAMIGRQVFAFSSAYLLSGEPRYLDRARRGANYLLENAWDEEYGGWYDRLNRDGTPQETTKSVQLQLYTNVGLTQYFAATGDERALDNVRRSIEIRRSEALDEEYGGYYQRLERDLDVADRGKNKHAHYGYVGSHTLNMFLVTRDPAVLAWERELCDLSIERQMDGEGWIYGFDSEFDREWRMMPEVVDGEQVLSIGAQLTAALAFLRLHHQTGASEYLERGKRIADNVNRYGWDERGFFWDRLGKETREPIDGATVPSWIQFYGCFLQLQLYNLTGAEQYLDRFRTAERFYLEQIVDEKHGGVHLAVDGEGEPAGNDQKASTWNTAYHEIEHAFLAALYLDLYVNGEPATLHFRFDGGSDGRKHYVSPVDDPRVGIEAVTIDGEPWQRFDAEERSVTLPPEDDLAVTVTLSPVPGR